MVQEELAAHEEEGEVVQTPSDEQETAQGVVFDDLGCDDYVSTDTLRLECGLLFSKSLYPLLARKMRKPRTRMYAATAAVLNHHTQGLPIR